MRSLYTRILLSCVATLLFSFIAFLVITTSVGIEDYNERFSYVFQLQLHEAGRAYEDGGPEALRATLQRLDTWFGSTHRLLDSSGRDLITGENRLTNLPERRASFVARTYRQIVGLTSTGIHKSEDGRYNMLVTGSPWANRPAQIPYVLGVIIVTAIVYSFLALGIASALKTIAGTTDRFGQGDLDARLAFTDRKDEIGTVARSFNAMAARLQTLLIAERRLLQDVSHELRSPLARLAFAAELVRTAPNRDKAVDRLKKELHSLSSLVTSLLEVTRAEGDPTAHKLESVKVEEVVREVVDSCTLEAEARKCRIVVSGSTPARIWGDRELLRRAFDNVVRNSLHYSPEGGEIDVVLKEAGGDTTVEVRDYGPGVPDELLSKIFEPFFRAEPSRQSSSDGVGLGLSIVQRVVQLHHGRLAAANTHPGLRVTITMPKAA